MSKRFVYIGIISLICLFFASCKDDVANTGVSVLSRGDAIVVLSDTFSIHSEIDSCAAIISQADSFLLGEIETDYGLLRASILTQLACPEGYSYPTNAEVDSICLFMYYNGWVGDGSSPLAINAYLMDKGTFRYNASYPTDLNISDYCSRDKSILVNHRIVAASEKMDSVLDETTNTYVPMLRMRLNDDFMQSFWSIRSFTTQEAFNKQFNGLLIESSFGSSTVLNISDIALGVYYHFSYPKSGRDTTVNDMKAFYANSEVRTVNHLSYRDKAEWIDALKADSDYYNYVVGPAAIYTRLTFPMDQMADTIYSHLVIDTLEDGTYTTKRPYVNLADVRIDIENVFTGSSSEKGRNDWLQPSKYMLLIKESSIKRFFANKELPSDTCALLCSLMQDVDAVGNTRYYYSFDLSDFLTNQLRQPSTDAQLKMVLMPVSVSSVSTTTSSISSVQQAQTLSATKIRSAKNGLNIKLVYSGF